MIVILVVEVLFRRFEFANAELAPEHTLSESTFLCCHGCFLMVVRFVVTFCRIEIIEELDLSEINFSSVPEFFERVERNLAVVTSCPARHVTACEAVVLVIMCFYFFRTRITGKPIRAELVVAVQSILYDVVHIDFVSIFFQNCVARRCFKLVQNLVLLHKLSPMIKNVLYSDHSLQLFSDLVEQSSQERFELLRDSAASYSSRYALASTKSSADSFLGILPLLSELLAFLDFLALR